MASARILIVDDHPLIGDVLKLAIHALHPHIQVDVASSVAAVEAMCPETRSLQLVLLDYRLPDSNEYSGLLRLQYLLVDVPIAIISGFEDASIMERARVLGAQGFLSKTQPLDQLAEMVDRMLAGERVFPPQRGTAHEIDAARALLETLSAAQCRVLLALARGQLNRQIASELNLSEATTKAHLRAVFRKLRVRNRTQAVLSIQPLLQAMDQAG
ncbi:LuxR C-terminal-related transcriptional regulator [Sphingomonas prati]|uniref:DNA-binding NarL/FixJ family response regulator n=1 Tax=Sphingomonas prati TaxID=1843237 RepID=A0A7W9F4V6_9SPHN|nr:response regulator transcription factor [Sphingomonas prati]MBB5730865.1 DNA-binding NarL/FixJ family response regulator [Sphingomonas prati]GGE97084.1 DNA-binding response regulator [Sphingomonas prati]